MDDIDKEGMEFTKKRGNKIIYLSSSRRCPLVDGGEAPSPGLREEYESEESPRRRSVEVLPGLFEGKSEVTEVTARPERRGAA